MAYLMTHFWPGATEEQYRTQLAAVHPDDRLEVRIERAVADDAARDGELDPRRVRVSPVGHRWLGVRLPTRSL